MASEGDAPDTRISNWTLATGTSPGQRQLSSPPIPNPPCRPAEAVSRDYASSVTGVTGC